MPSDEDFKRLEARVTALENQSKVLISLCAVIYKQIPEKDWNPEDEKAVKTVLKGLYLLHKQI